MPKTIKKYTDEFKPDAPLRISQGEGDNEIECSEGCKIASFLLW